MENSRKSTRVSWAAAPSSSQKVPFPKNYFAWHVERKGPESQRTPPRISQIKWRCPAEVALKGEWRVASGEESHEAETQRNRDFIVAEALYAHPSLTPPNPSDLLDKGGPQNDDSRTPVIPLTPRDDAAMGTEAERGDSEANASADVCGLEDFDRQLWVGSDENPLFTISMVVLHLLASNPELRSTVLNFINGECTSLPTICLGVLRSVTAGGFVPCRCTTSTANVAVQTEDTEERIRDESNLAQAPLEVVEAPPADNLTCGLMSNGEEEFARHSPLTTDLPTLNGNAPTEASPTSTQSLARSPSPDEENVERLIRKYLGANAGSSMEQGRSRLHQDEWKELVERYGISNNATRAPPYPSSSSSSSSSSHQHIRPVNNYGVLNAAMNRPMSPSTPLQFRPNVPSFGPGTAYHMANSPYVPLHPPGTTPMMISPPPYAPVPSLSPPGTAPMMTSPQPYAPVPSLSPPSNHLVQFYAATLPGSTTNLQQLGNAAQLNQKKQKPCMYFSTAGGCRNGEKCSYLHVVHSSTGGNVLDSQAAKRMRLG